jgi:SAM-dependent methyltransferase
MSSPAPPAAAVSAATPHGYDAKGGDYYSHARREVLPHVPETARRVLEIGCGAGATLALLRHERQLEWAGGIELFPDAAATARTRLDQVWEGNIEHMPLGLPPVDVILALDVLEHLVDPWEVVRRAAGWLRPGGRMIVILPNVRYVAARLLWHGEWEYQSWGVLDATHLRFFTRTTGMALLQQAGLKMLGVHRLERLRPLSRKGLINALMLGRLRDMYSKQLLFVAEKPHDISVAAQ